MKHNQVLWASAIGVAALAFIAWRLQKGIDATATKAPVGAVYGLGGWLNYFPGLGVLGDVVGSQMLQPTIPATSYQGAIAQAKRDAALKV